MEELKRNARLYNPLAMTEEEKIVSPEELKAYLRELVGSETCEELESGPIKLPDKTSFKWQDLASLHPLSSASADLVEWASKRIWKEDFGEAGTAGNMLNLGIGCTAEYIHRTEDMEAEEDKLKVLEDLLLPHAQMIKTRPRSIVVPLFLEGRFLMAIIHLLFIGDGSEQEEPDSFLQLPAVLVLDPRCSVSIEIENFLQQ